MCGDGTCQRDADCEHCANWEHCNENLIDVDSPECEFVDDSGEPEPDESMDGDFDSAMTSAGFGTDEDYGYFGDGE